MTTFTAAPSAPRADRFRLGDRWRGPDLRLYLVRRAPALPDHVILRPISGGHSVLEHRSHVQQGWRRAVWGGRWE